MPPARPFSAPACRCPTHPTAACPRGNSREPSTIPSPTRPNLPQAPPSSPTLLPTPPSAPSPRRARPSARRRASSHNRPAQRGAAAALGDDLPNNPRRLARLELPIYVTTNYDDYLERAFAAVGRPAPAVEICRWNDALVD